MTEVHRAVGPSLCRSSLACFLRHASIGRVISPSQRPLPDTHTTLTTDKHPDPRLDSNPQSQQASACRPNTICGYTFLSLSVIYIDKTFRKVFLYSDPYGVLCDVRAEYLCKRQTLVRRCSIKALKNYHSATHFVSVKSVFTRQGLPDFLRTVEERHQIQHAM